MSFEDNNTYDPVELSHLVSLDPDGRIVFNKQDFLSFLQTDLPGFYVLLNWPEKKVLEVSPSVKTITGYSKEKFACGGVDFYTSLCHPCERAFLKYVHKEILMFYFSLAPGERLKYQYTFDVTICKPDNVYGRLSCQLFCLKMDESLNPLYVVGFLTNKPADDKNYVTLVIKKIDEEPDGKEIEFRYKTQYKLTQQVNERTEPVLPKLESVHFVFMDNINTPKSFLDTF